MYVAVMLALLARLRRLEIWYLNVTSNAEQPAMSAAPARQSCILPPSAKGSSEHTGPAQHRRRSIGEIGEDPL